MTSFFVAIRVGVGLCVIALVGCANKPTVGDQMRQHTTKIEKLADLNNQVAKDWDRGAKLVVTGKKRIVAGEKQVKLAESDRKKGEDDIVRGKSEIAEGEKLISESENIFQQTILVN